MSALKKILALVIIASSITVAVLLVVGANTNKPSVKNTSPTQISIKTSDKNYVNIPVNKLNLTNQLAATISQEVIEQSKSNDATGFEIADAEQFIEEYIGEGLSGFDYQSLKPDIKPSDLKIINNDAPTLATSYLEALSDILHKNFLNTVQLNPTNMEEVADSLSSDIAKHQNVIETLYELAVPQQLSFIHQEIIKLLTARQRIYEYILDYENDPLKAILAWRFTDVFREEFLAVARNIETFINENTL